MAENENEVEQKDVPEILEDSLSKTEVLLEENKDIISKVLMGIAIVVAFFFILNNFVWEPAEEAALDSVWEPQALFEKEAFDSAAVEFESVAEEFGGTDAGNTANLYLGISQMKQGEFESALESISNFEPKGDLMPGLKEGLIADCNSELGNIDEAVSGYKKAASMLDAKTASPYYLKKAGILLEQNGDAAGAVEVYQLAYDKYLKNADRNYDQSKQDILKYLARAKAK